MNIQETSYWVDRLLPGAAQFHRVGDFTVAAFENINPDSPGEVAACTVNFGRVDTGLVTAAEAESVEVRSELLCLARASVDVPGRAVAAAATMLHDASLTYLESLATSPAQATEMTPMHAQPGRVLPAVGIMANLPQEGYTVKHGILADPRIWGPEIPYVREEAGEVNLEPGEEASGLARLTLPLQLILLTDEEFAVAVQQGGDVLFQQMAEQQVDLLDLHR
ncbi:Suppressor of fused protein (SUFU) [Corynebacterium faecale]|uniref:suppressor of fused domain protein n=1 Tax=Corynebacterium faecale TaxID=1758466 RepID=UPI0025B569C5|nr:suppressor of fused domain protein [Corynebacterium faecale]WJY91064.1 Suppressor of fused protein (SUFU) [Corynebacterium faecale]